MDRIRAQQEKLLDHRTNPHHRQPAGTPGQNTVRPGHEAPHLTKGSGGTPRYCLAGVYVYTMSSDFFEN